MAQWLYKVRLSHEQKSKYNINKNWKGKKKSWTANKSLLESRNQGNICLHKIKQGNYLEINKSSWMILLYWQGNINNLILKRGTSSEGGNLSTYYESCYAFLQKPFAIPEHIQSFSLSSSWHSVPDTTSLIIVPMIFFFCLHAPIKRII